MLLTDSQRKWVSFLKEASRKKPPTKEIRPEVLATTVGLCSRQLHKSNGRTIKKLRSLRSYVKIFGCYFETLKHSAIKENAKNNRSVFFPKITLVI